MILLHNLSIKISRIVTRKSFIEFDKNVLYLQVRILNYTKYKYIVLFRNPFLNNINGLLHFSIEIK